MRCRAERVRTACRVSGRVCLASLVLGWGFGSLSSPVQAADRYDKAIFVCRSVDPTTTLLNIREKPFGQVLGRLSSQRLVYVKGRDLRQPIRGFVPIRFDLELGSDDRRRSPGTLPSAPAGWVWKTYLTCELAS